MVQINFAQKSVTVKIVYYGPGMSGKTTNLEIVHQRAPEASRGELTSISTDGERTLFFDFMPLDLGTVAGMRTQFQIYTVPGQVYYNSTRKLVLQGVDGVIFVADSSASMVEENLESLKNLADNLADYGKDLAELPLVIQYNKRDLPDAMSVEELDQLLNPGGLPSFEAVANTGQGVFPTLKALAARVLESVHRTSGGVASPPPAVGSSSPTTGPSGFGQSDEGVRKDASSDEAVPAGSSADAPGSDHAIPAGPVPTPASPSPSPLRLVGDSPAPPNPPGPAAPAQPVPQHLRQAASVEGVAPGTLPDPGGSLPHVSTEPQAAPTALPGLDREPVSLAPESTSTSGALGMAAAPPELPATPEAPTMAAAEEASMPAPTLTLAQPEPVTPEPASRSAAPSAEQSRASMMQVDPTQVPAQRTASRRAASIAASPRIRPRTVAAPLPTPRYGRRAALLTVAAIGGAMAVGVGIGALLFQVL